MKVKTHDKPTAQNVNGESRHCPLVTKRNYYRDDSNRFKPYNLVNIRKGHDTIFSLGGLLQAVKRNGKCMLILGGTNPYSENSKDSVKWQN